MPDPTIEARRLAQTASRAITLVVAVFVFFFAAYVLTASADVNGNGDTAIRIDVADSLVTRHALDLAEWKLLYPHHIKKEFLETRVDTGRGGKTYSTYELGQSLAIVPFDAAGTAIAIHERWPLGPAKVWFARLVGPLFGALEVTVFFMFAVRLGYGRGGAFLLSLILAFATTVWPDEQSVLEHTEVSFFMLLAAYLAFRMRDQGKGWHYALGAGVALGGAAITRYQDAFLGLVAIALYLILPGIRARRILPRIAHVILFGIGIAPFLAADVWYNWYRFGSILATGHHERVFGNPIVQGAEGLLFSPGKGIVWYCPVIFLLLIAGPLFARRYSAFSIAVAVMVVSFFVLYGYVTYWYGDPAWGPRYVYPLVPFLTLPLGEIFRLRLPWAIGAWPVTLVVVLISLIVQIAGVSVSEWRSWYRVIAYEESQGHPWEWIASRYQYFWNVQESPLLFQVRGLYQLAYDDLHHTTRYVIVPPDEDPILDKMTTDYAINQWNFWWASNEFNWWVGEQKIIAGVAGLLALMMASGIYVGAEAAGVFESRKATRSQDEPIPEAA